LFVWNFGNSGADLQQWKFNGFQGMSCTSGITASTTQTQGQQPLTTEINEVSTVANDQDTVTLPAAAIGRRCVVFNNGANILRIFPASGDDCGAGANTQITLAAGDMIVLHAYDATNWRGIAGTPDAA